MAAAESVLAVDFGTSNTVAVLERASSAGEPLLFDGSPTLPSAVLATVDGRVLVGRDAQRAAGSDPARCEPHPKRRIDDGALLLGDRELPVEELIAAVLERVLVEAQRVEHGDVDRLVLTHPAAWSRRRTRLLREAARIAGFTGEPEFVPEPVAAAHRFASNGDFGTALVYDLGAGTCDLTVVARGRDGVEVRRSEGLIDLGGLDIDHAIVDYLRRRNPDESWQRLEAPRDSADRRHRRLLWEDVREVKELLSRESHASLYLPLPDIDTHLTRQELEDLAAPLLRRSIRLAHDMAASVEVDSILLTGGGSRMPLVATELMRALQIAPVLTEQPELVIAAGALRAAGSEPSTTSGPMSTGSAAPDTPIPLDPVATVDTAGPGFGRTPVADRAAEFDPPRTDVVGSSAGLDPRREDALRQPAAPGSPGTDVVEPSADLDPRREDALRHPADFGRPPVEAAVVDDRDRSLALLTGRRRFPFTVVLRGVTRGEVDAFLTAAIDRVRSGQPLYLAGRRPHFTGAVRGYDPDQVNTFLNDLERVAPNLVTLPSPEWPPVDGRIEVPSDRVAESPLVDADEVRNVQFRTTRLRRGYAMAEVDGFLDQAEERVQNGLEPLPRRVPPVFTETLMREGYDPDEVDAFVSRLRAASPHAR